jgi:hypothetical protein
MRTATAALFATFVLSALPGLACVAQDKPTAKAEPFVVEAGETKLTDLIDRAAIFLGWNILSNEQEMAAGGPGTIRLQHRIEVHREGCEEVLTAMLYRAGFAITAIDEGKQLYEVISMNGPRSRELMSRAVRRTPEEILRRPNLKMAATTAVQLKHINASIATNALRPFFAATGSPTTGLTLGNLGNNSALVIAGMQDQVAIVLRFLETCDVPQTPEQTPASAERLEALEKRVAALEQKLSQNPR